MPMTIEKLKDSNCASKVKQKATDNLMATPSKVLRTELHKFANQLIESHEIMYYS